MKLLDLFCGAGGCSVGYARAGFEVAGVDLHYQKDYPFDLFQGDALDYLDDIIDLGADFDVIHASPPCQMYSKTKHAHDVEHPALLEPVTKMLRQWAEETGGIYIIENVPGAEMDDPLILCGTQFGLTATDEDGTPLVLHRHRLFESNFPLLWPGRCKHKQYKNEGYRVAGVYGGGSTNPGSTSSKGGYTPHLAVKQKLMGIDWMNQDDLHQAIPPAYTEFIGKQLMQHLGSGK